MIPQVRQRREHIVPKHGGVGRPAPGGLGDETRARQAILQLEHHPCSCLLADTRNRRQTGDVTAFDGAHELLRLDAGEHGERHLRTDAADADQALEEIQLQQRRESVQQQRVFTHVRVNPQRDLGAGLAQSVERGQRHGDIVADAVDVNDDAIGVFGENAAAEVRDHDRAGR